MPLHFWQRRTQQSPIACEGNPCRALGGGPSRGQDDPRRMFRRSKVGQCWTSWLWLWICLMMIMHDYAWLLAIFFQPQLELTWISRVQLPTNSLDHPQLRNSTSGGCTWRPGIAVTSCSQMVHTYSSCVHKIGNPVSNHEKYIEILWGSSSHWICSDWHVTWEDGVM